MDRESWVLGLMNAATVRLVVGVHYKLKTGHCGGGRSSNEKTRETTKLVLHSPVERLDKWRVS